MSFKYTLVCDTLPWAGYNVLEMPDEVLQAAKAAGYEGVDLPGDPTRMDGKEWRDRVAAAGLVVPEILGAWGYYHAGEERLLASPDEAIRKHAVDYALATVDLAVDVGAQYMELCAAQPAVPQLPFPLEPIPALRKAFRQSIAEICERAGEKGLTILLEPLNCYEGLPGVLTTLYEAMSYCDELGFDNLGIQPDIYHMNIEEGSILDAVRAAGPRIKHFHLNETNHGFHGTGHGDYQGVMRILKAIGYDGYIATYLPQISQQILHSAPGTPMYATRSKGVTDAARPELTAVLEQMLAFLKSVERAVETSRDFYEVAGFRGD